MSTTSNDPLNALLQIKCIWKEKRFCNYLQLLILVLKFTYSILYDNEKTLCYNRIKKKV